MISADKIKWIIENIKPEGFEYKASKYNHLDDQIRFANGDYARRYDLYSDEWKYDKYGDFLQKVIEGVNRIKDTHTRIVYGCSEYGANSHISVADYKLFKPLASYYEKDFDYIDQVKEKAILYIVDKIKGEG